MELSVFRRLIERRFFDVCAVFSSTIRYSWLKLQSRGIQWLEELQQKNVYLLQISYKISVLHESKHYLSESEFVLQPFIFLMFEHFFGRLSYNFAASSFS